MSHAVELSPRTASEAAKRLDRRFVLRILAFALALGFYYSSDWIAIRRPWRAVFVWSLDRLGVEARATPEADDPGILVHNTRFSVTRNCTYLGMLLLLAPLVWRVSKPLRVNLSILAALAVSLVAFNYVRVMTAIYLHVVRGTSWSVVHVWPDFLFQTAILTGAALLAMRADWRELT